MLVGKNLILLTMRPLANGLGNFCSRLAKMANLQNIAIDYQAQVPVEFIKYMNDYDLTQALNFLDKALSELDQYLAQEKPWLNENKNQQEVLTQAIHQLLDINRGLGIFIPETAKIIDNNFNQNQIQAFAQGLFKRI